MLKAHEIRRRFLDYFAKLGHTIVPSSSLVPSNDPSLLFVNSGMVQFKDTFLGREKRPYSRATSVQRCLRAGGKHNDLDNVGFTPRHHTLFEMLGNFSFGDYFKRETIAWAWQFLTQELAIPAERLVVTVFNGEGEPAPFDVEALEIWSELIPRERIYSFSAKDNFWQMGETGPCGPCSEIHIFSGKEAPGYAQRSGKYGPAYEEDKYVELWNLVFMQYEKLPDGSLIKLQKPSIDTGAGLERIAAVLEGVGSNYETELLKPLVDRAKQLAGFTYAQGSGANESAFRVIADHARATAFLLADGVFPDRTGRSYVLRRIMRRAIRYGTKVGLDKPFFHKICALVVEEFGESYPELIERAAVIDEIVQIEEDNFRRTLDRGLKRLDATFSSMRAEKTEFPIEVAADLYDTYGFPIDLTALICREHQIELDETAAQAEVYRRQKKSDSEETRLGGEQAIRSVYFHLHEKFAKKSQFVGYHSLRATATVLVILVAGEEAEQAEAGARIEIVCDTTPFYAESGGQIGDTGKMLADGVLIKVIDTKKPYGDLHIHQAVVERGRLHVGQTLELVVDQERREAIRRNHSATHLLHHALRKVVGPHVVQKGSFVAPDRLRFDFSHTKPLTWEQRREIETIVNEFILTNLETQVRECSLEQAKTLGAIGLFGEKYGEEVRVISIAGESIELCGGTHVQRSGDIGLFAIVSETGIAQGVRRIEAVTGSGALAYMQEIAGVIGEVASQLHAANLAEIPARIAKLQAEIKLKEREMSTLQRTLATGANASAEVIRDVDGFKLIAKDVGFVDPKTLRETADTLRDRLGSGIVVLGGKDEKKATILVAVTKDLISQIQAGKLASALAHYVDGRGGGRPELAQAGGTKLEGLEAALQNAAKELKAILRSTNAPNP